MEIREIKLADYQAIAHFLANFPILHNRQSENYWLNSFQTLWEMNLFLHQEYVRGWLIIDQDQVGGCLLQFPSYFQQEAVFGITSSSSTWFVLEKYRTKSFGLLQKLLQDNKQKILFTTTPSEATIPIIKKMGYKELPSSLENLSIIFVDSVQSLQFFLFKKQETDARFKFAKSNTLNKLISVLASPLLYFWQKIKIKLPKSNETKLIEQASSDFDKLWEKTKQKFQFTGVRSSQQINWFCSDLNFEKKIFAHYQNNELKAYAIFRFRMAANQFKQLEMLDFFGENFEESLPHIVGFANEYASENKVAFITFPHFNKEVSKILDNLGLQKVFVGKNAYFKASSEIVEQITEQNFYFTHLQGDYGFA